VYYKYRRQRVQRRRGWCIQSTRLKKTLYRTAVLPRPAVYRARRHPARRGRCPRMRRRRLRARPAGGLPPPAVGHGVRLDRHQARRTENPRMFLFFGCKLSRRTQTQTYLFCMVMGCFEVRYLVYYQFTILQKKAAIKGLQPARPPGRRGALPARHRPPHPPPLRTCLNFASNRAFFRSSSLRFCDREGRRGQREHAVSICVSYNSTACLST
jgi:hypothetical protein